MARRDSVTVSMAAERSGMGERDVAAQPGAQAHLVGMDLGVTGKQQDVVEGEGEGWRVVGHRWRESPATGGSFRSYDAVACLLPQHFLYFLPEPQEHGSLRPTFSSLRTTVPGLGEAALGGAEN